MATDFSWHVSLPTSGSFAQTPAHTDDPLYTAAATGRDSESRTRFAAFVLASRGAPSRCRVKTRADRQTAIDGAPPCKHMVQLPLSELLTGFCCLPPPCEEPRHNVAVLDAFRGIPVQRMATRRCPTPPKIYARTLVRVTVLRVPPLWGGVLKAVSTQGTRSASAQTRAFTLYPLLVLASHAQRKSHSKAGHIT